jgi:GDPmannose 4,6-dehydratase
MVVGVRRALITGITGQDGSYLAELLLSKGYEVHGIMRRASSFNTGRIDPIFDRLTLHFGDMTDATGLRRALELARPDEVYNLAAQSHVRVSFDQPEYTADVVALGTLRLLDAVRDMRAPIRFYQAGSSEMFGTSPPPQNEETPMRPCSPYGASKLAAHWYARGYRDAYGLFIACGILHNHESPRRGETFVTRKITRAMTRMALGLQSRIVLGNLESRRDWGFAGDYVEAMWRMLQQERPDDYVIATGESHSVRDWLEVARNAAGVVDCYIALDRRLMRPAEVEHLRGDASKAQRDLGWAPTVGFEDLVKMMVESDMRLAKQEKLVRDHG